MVDHVVYRKLPDLPHRQYVRRIIDRRYVLWHRDPAVALRMERKEAITIARIINARSIGKPNHPPTEPAGMYGVEEAS